MNYSVIIPNYNGEEFLLDCLRSLDLSFKKCPGSQFEIILVDNASVDHSPKIFFQFCQRHQLTASVISLPQNLGFATPVNRGITAAAYEYVVVCNNDLILSPDWFKLISESIKTHPDFACFTGTVLNRAGTEIESQGIDYDFAGKCFQLNHGQKFKNYKFKIKNSLVWGSSAALVVYRRDIINKIGLFDERFFAYLEDVDVAFRLSKKNYQTLLIPAATCRHLGGGTSNKMGNLRAKNTFRNWILLIHKNYSVFQIIFNFPGLFLERCRNFSYFLRSTPVSRWPTEITSVSISLLKLL